MSSIPRSSKRKRKRKRLRFSEVVLCAILAVVPTTAKATPEAEALFDEGKRLLAEGRVPEACKAFEKSFAVDPLGGTLMGLAICHEKQGLLATALREYDRAAEIAKAADRQDRVEHALLAMESLRLRVPHLVVEVPAEGRPAGLVVKIDGVPLAPQEWNADRVVDPGAHRIEWSAQGIAFGSAAVTLKEGARQQVQVLFERPALATVEEEETGLEPTTIAGIVTGAASVAALGAGAVLGVVALGKGADSDADCDVGGSPVTCGPSGLAAFDSGRDLALASDITLAAGLLLAGASVTLFLWPTDDDDASAAAPWVRAAGGPDIASIVAGGRF